MSKIIDLSLYRNSTPFTTKSSALSSLKSQLSNAKDGSIVLVRYYGTDGNTSSDIKTIFGFSYNNASKKYYTIYDLDEVTNTCKKYTDQAIDNIKIGGRNILLGTKSTEKTENRNISYFISTPLIVNEYYTFSGYIKANRQANNVDIYVNDDTGADRVYLHFGTVQLTTSYKKIILTKQCTKFVGSQINNIFFRIYGSEGDVITCKEVKLEQGNKPTSWTPAPEDKQDKLISGTNIKTINGVSLLGSGNIAESDPVFNAWKNSLEVVAGLNAKSSPWSVAIGPDTKCTDGGQVAIGSGAIVSNYQELALGDNNKTYTGLHFSIAKSGSTSSSRSNCFEILNNGDVKIQNMPNKGSDGLGSLQSYVSSKQDKLVSGTSIKTINGQSLLSSGNINLGVNGLYTSSTAYSEANCIDYCTRKSAVSWPQSDLVEPKGDSWKVGNFIFLVLKCTNGDNYIGYQKVVGESSLLPVSYFIMKQGPTGPKGDKGDKGEGLPLVQTTGTSTTNAMSQKATTDAIKSKVNNIKIGGRNLALDSSKEITNTSGQRHYLLVYNFAKLKGNPVYISYDYEYTDVATGGTTQTSRFGFETPLKKPDGSYSYAFGGSVNLDKNATGLNGSGRSLAGPINVPMDVVGNESILDFYFQIKSGNVRIHNVKLEQGNIPTAWTPAPEDMQAEINALKKIDGGTF